MDPNGLQAVGNGVSLLPWRKITGTRSTRPSLPPKPITGFPSDASMIVGKSVGNFVPTTPLGCASAPRPAPPIEQSAARVKVAALSAERVKPMPLLLGSGFSIVASFLAPRTLGERGWRGKLASSALAFASWAGEAPPVTTREEEESLEESEATTAAERDDPAAAAGRLLRAERQGALATLSLHKKGWPFGSVAPYALSERGEPLLLLSALAQHTKNALADPRASLLVQDSAGLAPGADLQAHARLTVLGRIGAVPPTEEDDARARYLARHPQAGRTARGHDFRFYALTTEEARFIGRQRVEAEVVPAGCPPGLRVSGQITCPCIVLLRGRHGPDAAEHREARVGLQIRTGREPRTVLHEQAGARVSQSILCVLRERAEEQERLSPLGERVGRDRAEGPALLVQRERGQRALPLGSQQPACGRRGIVALGGGTRLALLDRKSVV